MSYFNENETWHPTCYEYRAPSERLRTADSESDDTGKQEGCACAGAGEVAEAGSEARNK